MGCPYTHIALHTRVHCCASRYIVHGVRHALPDQHNLCYYLHDILQPRNKFSPTYTKY